VSVIKDVALVLLLLLVMPLGMIVAFVGLAVILGRALYLWIRDNTTATSRWHAIARDALVPPMLTPQLVPVPVTMSRAPRRR
jgi:hypothetical protein